MLIGVDAGADALLAAGHQPDVVVLSSPSHGEDRVSAKALAAARDVVVVVDRGDGHDRRSESLERLGVRPLRFETGAPPRGRRADARLAAPTPR